MTEPKMSLREKMMARQEPMPSAQVKPKQPAKEPTVTKSKEKPKPAPKIPPTRESDLAKAAAARLAVICAVDATFCVHPSPSNATMSDEQEASLEKRIEESYIAISRYMSLRDLVNLRWNADGTPKVVEEPK